MFRFVTPVSIALLAGAAISLTQSDSSPASAVPVPAPAIGAELRTGAPLDTAVFAGGCFWGIEAVFEHIKGVRSAVSGYAGGKTTSPSYDEVSTGSTGHAESVRVVYDPAVVSYGQLLQVFFSVAHDPTQLNRQGPDTGPSYRSEIFFASPAQERIAKAYVQQLTRAKVFSAPIVTSLLISRA